MTGFFTVNLREIFFGIVTQSRWKIAIDLIAVPFDEVLFKGMEFYF
jgi:hypothetical protein